MSVLTGESVSKAFGGSLALNGVSFRLESGEVLGLIGPNGAGKTTLINVISGLMTSRSGEIRFKGSVISGCGAHRIAQAGIARTFQLVRPFMGMTVEENVLIGAAFGTRGRHTRRLRRDRVRDALDFVGLTGIEHERVETLTIPDRKRVELARALAMEPEVLLLDEVMAGLNPREIDAAINLVREINRSGVSVIVVEHLMEAVVGLCERVIVLHHGEKIADGPTRAVLDDDRVVEAYLGRRYSDRARTPADGGA